MSSLTRLSNLTRTMATSAQAPSSRVAIVTGSNQGIGYGICSRLARLWNEPQPLTLYFTSRSVDRGQEALAKLKDELKNEKTGDVSFEYHQLDITDANSRKQILADVKEKHGGLDLLISNAGIALDGFDAQVVKDTLATNYWSTNSMTKETLPLLRKDGRVVVVASMAGKLNGYSEELTQRFKNVKSESDADTLMKEFTAAVEQGNHSEKGWKSAAYSVSKAGVIAWHKAVAQQEKDVRIFTVCPGYVNSRMTKGKGVRTLDEGAATPVTCALESIPASKSGTFWENSKESVWG